MFELGPLQEFQDDNDDGRDGSEGQVGQERRRFRAHVQLVPHRVVSKWKTEILRVADRYKQTFPVVAQDLQFLLKFLRDP